MKKYILFVILAPAALFGAATGSTVGFSAAGAPAVSETVTAEASALLPLEEVPINGSREFHAPLSDLSGVAGIHRLHQQPRSHSARFCGESPALSRPFRFSAGVHSGFRGAAAAISPCPVRPAAAIEARAGPFFMSAAAPASP